MALDFDALALDKPVIPVSTLAALAYPAQGGRILAAIDARMGEVYLGAFVREGDDLVACMDEIVVRPDLAVVPDGDGGPAWHGVGTGFSAVDGALRARLGKHLIGVDATVLPHAGDVAQLGALAYARGEALPPEQAEPAYLRNHVALTLVQQQALRESR